MNSPTSRRAPRNRIVTTCRGRLEHLREALPTWLERLPDWDPVVVCCDDPEALEYASGELALAGRGIVVNTLQGERFNALEAKRLGVRVAVSPGFESAGLTYDVFPDYGAPEPFREPPSDLAGPMIALFDADTIALRLTERGLQAVAPGQYGIAATTLNDDMGLLIASGPVLSWAFDQIPIGAFSGYGPEDCAIRVGCWLATGGRFVRLRASWSRRRHTDSLRTAFHGDSKLVAGRANHAALVNLMAAIVPKDQLAQCRLDILPVRKVAPLAGQA